MRQFTVPGFQALTIDRIDYEEIPADPYSSSGFGRVLVRFTDGSALQLTTFGLGPKHHNSTGLDFRRLSVADVQLLDEGGRPSIGRLGETVYPLPPS